MFVPFGLLLLGRLGRAHGPRVPVLGASCCERLARGEQMVAAVRERQVDTTVNAWVCGRPRMARALTGTAVIR